MIPVETAAGLYVHGEEHPEDEARRLERLLLGCGA
jgi:hypothetical protein